jgi:hypothetical protein
LTIISQGEIREHTGREETTNLRKDKVSKQKRSEKYANTRVGEKEGWGKESTTPKTGQDQTRQEGRTRPDKR